MKIISRAEAKQLGLTHYFTGKPCKHGHIAERRVSRGDCKDCIKNAEKRFYKKNRRDLLNKQMRYYSENTDKVKQYQKQYRTEHKDELNERHRDRYRNDPVYKMRFRMRGILTKQLKSTNESKESRLYDLMGYTPSELKSHIESQFVDGMNWQNHGEWHIDHIVPISVWIKVGITDPSVINALDNLQPLWAQDNLSKGDRVL